MSHDALSHCIQQWQAQQQSVINLIGSENYPSQAVLRALGSFLTYKYAEGYGQQRYYSGCGFANEIEQIAIRKAQQLFGVEFVNVQAHSGSQANQAVFFALLAPGDIILSLALAHGGHLTHGHPLSQTGRFYQVVHYYLKDSIIDYAALLALALTTKPKIIIAGYSCFPGIIDWAAFRMIADQVGAYLVADIAHLAGLIAGKTYPSPRDYAHVITSTTHKTLRGPRGAIIMAKEKSSLTQRIDRAVFPGIQGGPFINVIAAKAVAFEEALQDSFQVYTAQIIKNAQALGRVLRQRQIPLVFEDLASHLVVISLLEHPLSGAELEKLLEAAHILVNRNAIPADPRSFLQTSGIRIGTAAMTTVGMQEAEAILIAGWIADIITTPTQGTVLHVREQVIRLAHAFPFPFIA